ncbi:MAG: DUF1214 domain-containing protein [Hydrogenophilaceae bacterium]|jgi:hypothetical protein|nr:DUF1214 domain-containing protein [Hydrogenophilaceae bacterium]
MIGGLLKWAAAVVLGFLLGAGSALLVIGWGAQRSSVAAGAWTINTLAGSQSADIYTRAFVARVGLLALAQSETIYFQAAQDADGRPLTEGCRYELAGGPLPARWWSITLYAADNHLPRNEGDALSIDATSVRADEAGRWTAVVSAASPQDAENWISSDAAGEGFTLTLRLYNPTDAARNDPAQVPTPSLRMLGCGDAT